MASDFVFGEVDATLRDSDGDEKGTAAAPLQVKDNECVDLMHQVLQQLQIMNLHLATITNHMFEIHDIADNGET